MIYCFIDAGNDKRAEADFFKSLGSEGQIKSALEGGDDEEFDKANKISLYRYFIFHISYEEFDQGQ